ncbi:CHAT domain-containing protein [Microcoleus sp. herbarium12]|uniref:CHAT domain-containing protein n=1 Tax=Microcoleus sp. herbarium12 TaxID=3055437 RepID=UPI002FCFBA61
MKKILILASNPRKDLNLDREIRDLNKVIKRQGKDAQFDVQIELAVRPEDLQELFLEHEPLIIHFCGHGTGEQGLVLQNDAGREQLVSTNTFSNLLALHGKIQCVLLNACYSEIQAKAIIEHINFVIGMSQEIRDDAAIAFATGFYQALAYGKSIEESYKHGCVAIQIKIPEKITSGSRNLEGTRKFELIDPIAEAIVIQEHLKPVLMKKSELARIPEYQATTYLDNSSDFREAVKAEIARKRYREQAREVWDYFGRVPARVQPLTQREYRYRQALLNRVKDSWIKGFLSNALHTQVLIECKTKERPDAVQRPFDDVDDMPVELDESFEELQETEIYAEMGTGKTLLILGEPGTGKTITLLKIAHRLVARSEQDLSQPIPVVFTLSSWGNKRQTIAEWLVDELNNRYKIPPSLGKILIEQEELILLLDGLDEIAEKYRNAFVRALNQFIETHGVTDIVVCSRVREYDALSERLKLCSAICIQPLTSEQVYQYLDEAGNQLIHLKNLLKQDTELEVFARNPLILSVMNLAYRDCSRAELLNQLSSREQRYQRLFETYIKRMFQRGKKVKPYSDRQTKRWLHWLAKGMVKSSETVFLIEQLQPSWLHTNFQINIYYKIGVLLLTVLMSGLICLPIGMIIWWLDYLSGIKHELILVLIPVVSKGMTAGFIFGLIVALAKLEIKPVESIKWSWQEARKSLTYGLIFGVISGLIFGIQTALVFGNPASANMLGAYKLLGTQRAALITALAQGLFGILIYCLSRGFRGPEIDTRIFPNQGIWKSARSAGLLGLLGGLVVGLLQGLQGGLIVGPMVGITGFMAVIPALGGGLFYGLFLGLIFGGSAACIQHLTLRLILYFHKYAPWNYARFLNYAADCLFLQKVGGGYIFVHRMLLEHFAGMKLD